jgi:hypothetical protein
MLAQHCLYLRKCLCGFSWAYFSLFPVCQPSCPAVGEPWSRSSSFRTQKVTNPLFAYIVSQELWWIFRMLYVLKWNKIHTLNMNWSKEQLSLSVCLSKFFVSAIGCSASVYVAFLFLPHSSKNIRSDRSSSFPDSLFEVLNVVNKSTVDDLLYVPQKWCVHHVSCLSPPWLLDMLYNLSL